MDFLLQDLRFGVRRLAKTPAFTIIAVITLALGMGAATAIFSVVDAVLLKPLPFRDPEKLLVIWEQNPAANRYRMFVSTINFVTWQKQNRTLEQMAAIQDVKLNLTGGPNGHIDPEELKCERVSANLFPLLGVEAKVGRTFRGDEDQPGRTGFVLLSHALWQRRFGGDATVVGKTIRLRDQPYTVVGVLPPAFAVLENGVDAFLPLGLNPGDARTANNQYLTVIARRRESLDAVRKDLEIVDAQMEQGAPALFSGTRPSVFAFDDELVGGVAQSLWVLLGAVGCLLLMSCANVANLLLARGATQQKEIAMRTAMGAGRGRIITQFLTESTLLSLAGGAAGLLLATTAVYLLAHQGPASVPRLAQATLDWRLFAFALSVSLVTGVVFGLAPALQSSGGNLTTVLNEGGRGGTSGRAGRRLRNVLVVTEVALAVIVLIGAGLLMRSFLRLRGVDPGFRSEGVLTMRVPLAGGRNSATERRVAFFRQLTERVAGLPGVKAVGAVNALPLTGLGVGATFAVEGRPQPVAEQRPLALARSVTPGYFKSMGIPLLGGRLISESDTAQSLPVVVVNQALARRFWPGGAALGGRLSLDQQARAAEIVGVVGDVKSERVDREDWPTVYSAHAQAPTTSMTLVVRTSGAPMAMAAAVRREVAQMDRDQPVADVRSMEEVVELATAGSRFNTLLLVSFAAIAFALAAVGIYGVISYDVSRRTNEIGIRMALGAQPEDVSKLILGQGARLAVYGIVAGWIGAGVLTRWMGSMLYGVSPMDAWTFGAISILLAVVALAASFLPSRRAMGLSPVEALRRE